MAEKIVIGQIDIDMDAAIADNIDLKNKISDSKKAMEEAEASSGKLSAEYIQAQATYKALNSELKTNENLINKTVQANNAQAGSVGKLEAANSALRAEQKKLNLETEEGRKRNVEIVAQLNRNTAVIKENSDEQKKGWMNVGQYTSSIKDAIGGLTGLIPGLKSGAAGFQTMGGATKFALGPLSLIMIGVQLLSGVFKTFTPIVEKVEQILAGLGAVMNSVKNSVIGLFTGQKQHNESMKEAYNNAVALKKAQQELEDSTLALTVVEARSKRQIDELLLQSKDRTKSEKERSELIDKALNIEAEAFKKRKAIADEELRIAQTKLINGNNLTKQEIKNLKEQGVEYAQQLQEKKNISDDDIKALADALVKQENILQESVSLREKAINRQNALEEKAQQEAEKLEEKRQKALEKSQQKKEKAAADEEKRLQKEAEAARKKAEEAVAAMDLELLKWQLSNKEKVSSSETLSKELIAVEESRLNTQASKEAEILKTQLDSKLITQTEYTAQLLTLEDQKNTAIRDLTIQFEEQEKARKIEAAQLDFENTQALFEENALSQLEMQRAALKRSYDEDIKNAEKVGADKSLVEKKYQKANIALSKAERDAKLSLAKDFASNVASIAGENTKVGKAAAAAAATINTYQAATGAYAALAPIPIVGPVLGIAAAAAAIASGIANVKKIYAVQPGTTPSSDSSSSAVSSGSGSALTSSLQSVNTDIGQGIVSRGTDSGSTTNVNATTPVLVVDSVTNAQRVESSKVETATI